MTQESGRVKVLGAGRQSKGKAIPAKTRAIGNAEREPAKPRLRRSSTGRTRDLPVSEVRRTPALTTKRGLYGGSKS